MQYTTQEIVQAIVNYQNTWYMWTLLLFFAGFVTFLVMTARVNAHAKGKSKIAFFFAPWFPKTMLVIGERIYYDKEYEIIKGENGYHITTAYNEHYTTKFDPEENVTVRNAIGARGPEGIDSPFSLAWRWIVAASIVLYGAVMGLLAAYMDPRFEALRWLKIFGYSVPENITVLIVKDQSSAMMYSSIIMAAVFAWWLGNLLRITIRGIKVYKFVPITTASATIEVIPAIEPDSPQSVFKVLGSLVREGIKLELSENIRKLLDEIAKKMKTDIATVVQLLNRAAMSEIWRMELGNRLEEYQDVKEAAIAECQLKAKEIAPKMWANFVKIVGMVAVATLVIGFFVGYGVGAAWGAPQVQHYNYTNTTVTQTPVYNYPQSGSGGGGNTTITPAPPPPPPVYPTGGGK